MRHTSNFLIDFSTLQETLLLKWLTLHYQHVHPDSSRTVEDFGESLADGEIFAAVLISHVPQLAQTRFAPAEIEDPDPAIT